MMPKRELLTFRFKKHDWHLGEIPRMMGVLNVTPDSFSDGGNFDSVDTAVSHALAMAAAGVDVIDIGGESTRPGAERVPIAVEQERVLPVVTALKKQLPTMPLSIDTRKPEVAGVALESGADIINDVSGFRDPDMIRLAAATGAGCILMHMRGTPENMREFTEYHDLTGEIISFFEQRIESCRAGGIASCQIILDPGIGFSKNAAQNLELIQTISRFRALGHPVLMGPSRKSFIGKILGEEAAAGRIWGTAAAVALCVYEGADIVRVHDVAEMRDAALVAAAIRTGEISVQ